MFEFLEEWNRLTERIGFWLDLDAAYRTLDPTYIESVWWALEQIHAKGLLYESNRVVPYCPRCGTALSSHEVSQGYQDVRDRSVYVKLPLLDGEEQESLLVWTTTPWTLAGNLAAAVGADISYARVRAGEETLIVAEALVERVFGEGAEVLGTLRGSELVGRHYRGPIFALSDREPGGFPVLAGDFVTTEDGTGIVHMAPAFGEDDFRVGAANGLFDPTNPHTLYNPVTREGTYDERVVGYEGRSVNDPELIADLIEELRERGLLFREELHEHSYPHCWRCGTRLLYYAKPSWYIATSRLRDRLLAANETVNWYPPHIKHGRFGDWLANNVDWALSRERYWGTPLPIWRCTRSPDHRVCIGSFAELERRSGAAVGDPHRPYVDELTFPCEECGGQMRRVPEVIDVWFDSGSMPFAQHHAPFENQRALRAGVPGRLRLRGARPDARLVLLADRDLDAAERPRALPQRRLPRAAGRRRRAEDVEVKGQRRRAVGGHRPLRRRRLPLVLLHLEAAVGRLPLLGRCRRRGVCGCSCASCGTSTPSSCSTPMPATRMSQRPTISTAGRSRLAATVETVRERLDAYDATSAGRAIAAYVEDLSNWYVRRSRRRFWDGEEAALATLRTALITIAQLLAPFTPFIADELYDNLEGELPSVHLCDFPAPGERDLELEFAMATARETVRLGLAARRQGDVKVRQPLREAIVVADGREREAIERLGEVVREELNVSALRFVAAADELGTYTIKPNFRTLGPRFGKRMPQLAAAVAALDPAAVAASLRDGRTIVVSMGGADHELTAADLTLALAPLAGYGLEREGSHAVALDLTLDEELIAAGQAREIVHAVQAARKDSGLEITDRIELSLAGDEGLLDAARAHASYIASETLATSVGYGDGPSPGTDGPIIEIDGRELTISLQRA